MSDTGALCPVCDRQSLAVVQAADVTLHRCQHCDGLWFERGQLELFPNRPATQHFLNAALHAPGRCRKGGHAVSRALTHCARCGGAPAECPTCHTRLAMVPTPVCAVDVCTRCGGVWLDAGEFELLANLPQEPSPPRAKPTSPQAKGDWQIPAAAPAEMAQDAWHAPGHAEPIRRREAAGSSAFSCRHCGSGLNVHEAWAFDGDVYCQGCRPKGAVSGHALPQDLHIEPNTPRVSVHFGSPTYGVWGDVLGALADILTSLR